MRRSPVLFGGLAALHLACAGLAAFPPGYPAIPDLYLGFVFGIPFGQVSLAAIWSALAPQRMGTRLAIGLALSILAAAALSTFYLRMGAGEATIIVVGATALQSLLIQVPLWAARMRGGWRLASASDTPAAAREEVQFGIRQLLLWTAAVAAVLAVTRLLVSAEMLRDVIRDREPVLGFSILLVFNAALVLPTFWAVLARRWIVCLPWSLLVVVYALGVTVVEPLAFDLVKLTSGVPAGFWYLVNFSQLLMTLGSLFILRLAGLRLVRPPAR